MMGSNTRKAALRSGLLAGFMLLALAFTGQISSAAPALAPTLLVQPDSGVAGTKVLIEGNGFDPGGYEGLILWDGQVMDTIFIQQGGIVSEEFVIPNGNKSGHYVITICAGGNGQCFEGEFKQMAEAVFILLDPSPTPTVEETKEETDSDKDKPDPPSATPSPKPSATDPPSATPTPTATTTSEATATPSPTLTLTPTDESRPSATPEEDEEADDSLPEIDEIPDLIDPVLASEPSLMEFVLCNPPPGAQVLDFDDSGSGELVFPGEYTERWGVIIHMDSHSIYTTRPAGGTFSPPIALTHRESTDPEFGSYTRDFTFEFLNVQALVGLYVGLEEETEGVVDAYLRAYDSDGDLLDTSMVSIGPGPTAIDTCLVVIAPDSSEGILTVELSYDSVDREVFDHLFFLQNPSSIPVLTDATSIHIEVPLDGATLTTVHTPIRGIVLTTSDHIERVELHQNVFGVPGPGHYIGTARLIRDPADARKYVFYTLGLPLDPDVRSISATAYDSDGGVAVDTITVDMSELLATALVADTDIGIAAVEVTQGVRGDIPTFDDPAVTSLEDSFVHVADRRTVVRVYPSQPGSRGGGVDTFTARLVGTRDGVPLPGSPLSPIDPMLSPSSSWTLDEMRRDPAKSWQFVLPEEWTRAGLITLSVEVNPPGAYHLTECSGCEANNVRLLTGVRFRTSRSLTFYPIISVDHTDDDGNLHTPTYAEIATAFEWMLRAWPIRASALDIRGFRYVAADCVPPEGGISVGSKTVDRSTLVTLGVSGHCDTLRTAHEVGHTMEADLRLASGSHTQIPIMVSPQAYRGCSGRAGLPGTLFWQGACNYTLAQETWHSVSGFNHAGNQHSEIDGGGSDPVYVSTIDPHGGIEPTTYGFDTIDMVVIPPNDGVPDSGIHTHDFMSYGRDGRVWASLYTWTNIANEFFEAPGDSGEARPRPLSFRPVEQGPSEEMLVISGQITGDGEVRLNSAFLSTVIDPDGDDEAGSHLLQLRDASDRVLFERRFEPMQLTHEPGGLWTFHEYLPPEPGAVSVVLLADGVELGRISAGGADPQITLISPAGGEQWAETGRVNVSWQASDSDDDPLTYRLEASPDGGQSWQPLLTTDQPDWVLDLATLPGGGENWQVRVQASDGLHVGMDQVGGISVAPKAPLALILHPPDGASLPSGEYIELRGLGTDIEQGSLADAALEWQVDGQVVGHGTHWPIFDLSEGEHKISLLATNAGGLTGAMQITVLIGDETTSDVSEETSDLAKPRFLETLSQPLALIFIVLLLGLGAAAVVILNSMIKQRR